MPAPLAITYFSDILCVWAYVAEARLGELERAHQGEIAIVHRFVSVFGDAHGKLEAGWAARGGFDGYAAHVAATVAKFPPAPLHPDTWTRVRPRSSLSVHLMLKAVEAWEAEAHGSAALTATAISALRRAFFADAADIGRRDVQEALLAPLGIDLAGVDAALADGRAHARLAADYALAEKSKIEGSPTFLLNEGRQKLYGNVGFRVISANIRELLRTPGEGEASWC
jgi:predicted DsbA family dithiol-disulfide isomerase